MAQHIEAHVGDDTFTGPKMWCGWCCKTVRIHGLEALFCCWRRTIHSLMPPILWHFFRKVVKWEGKIPPSIVSRNP